MNAAHLRGLREQRRVEGKCPFFPIGCLVVGYPTPGRAACFLCLVRYRRYQRDRRASWFSKGLCSRCGKYQATDGLKVCEKCRRSDALLVAKRRKNRLAEGRCSNCGKKPPDEGCKS